MSAIFVEKRAMQYTYLRQEPRKQRHLEHDSHDKDQQQEIIHVRVQRDLFRNGRTQFVGGQEPEGHREDQEIAYGTTDEKHHGTEQEYPPYALFLVLVQSRTDKFPDLPHQIGESQQQGKPERGCHVCEKLGGQLDVDDVYMKIIVAEIG